MTTRRHFILIVPAAALALATARTASAQAAKLEETDPQAVALGYRHDATKIDAKKFPAYAPGSHEYVVVESGRLQLGIGDVRLELATGDSVYFAADVEHSYANVSAEPCAYYVAALIMRPRG